MAASRWIPWPVAGRGLLLVAGALNLFNVIRIGDNAYLGSLLAGV